MIASNTATGKTFTVPRMFAVSAAGASSGFSDMKQAYLRVWDRVLSKDDFEAQMLAPSIVGHAQVTNIRCALGAGGTEAINLNDESGNGYHWTHDNCTFSAADDPPVTTTTKYLKLLAHSSAASASSIAGVVFEAPAGGAVTGAKIGEFTGGTFLDNGQLEAGQAVLKVATSEFGGGSLTTSDTPVALVRNASNTTGMVSCTVIEE